MNHFTNSDFWECYNKLPVRIRRRADRKFSLLKANPAHGSLHLKKVGSYWSARVDLDFRVLAYETPSGLI
jgi:hypothetical protein